jgi:hypothetical protein
MRPSNSALRWIFFRPVSAAPCALEVTGTIKWCANELIEATIEQLTLSKMVWLTEMDDSKTAARATGQIEFARRLSQTMLLPPLSTAFRSLCSRPKSHS